MSHVIYTTSSGAAAGNVLANMKLRQRQRAKLIVTVVDLYARPSPVILVCGMLEMSF